MDRESQTELVAQGDHSWWVWPLVGVLGFFLLAYQNCASYDVEPPPSQKVSQ